MATTTKSLLTLSLALTFLVMSTPKSNALQINGVTLSVLVVNGTVLCSSTVTGPCTTCAPLNGVRVSVTQNGNVLASGNTASNGEFSISINSPNVLAQITSVNNMRVVINLPIPSCPIYAQVNTGRLEGIPFVQTVTGAIATLGVGNLVRVG